jgi:hypothetical protein
MTKKAPPVAEPSQRLMPLDLRCYAAARYYSGVGTPEPLFTNLVEVAKRVERVFSEVQRGQEFIGNSSSPA